MRSATRDRLRRVRRLLREATGEAKWDDYLRECSARGTTPMTRRAFERHRAHEKECNPQTRCC
jgi:hypothetical protein